MSEEKDQVQANEAVVREEKSKVREENAQINVRVKFYKTHFSVALEVVGKEDNHAVSIAKAVTRMAQDLLDKIAEEDADDGNENPDMELGV